jgi:hypothetical protein
MDGVATTSMGTFRHVTEIANLSSSNLDACECESHHADQGYEANISLLRRFAKSDWVKPVQEHPLSYPPFLVV